jgi:hypothetical protein
VNEEGPLRRAFFFGQCFGARGADSSSPRVNWNGASSAPVSNDLLYIASSTQVGSDAVLDHDPLAHFGT